MIVVSVVWATPGTNDCFQSLFLQHVLNVPTLSGDAYNGHNNHNSNIRNNNDDNYAATTTATD